MEKCPQCDNDRIPDEDFCDNCGHKYATPSESQPQPESQPHSQAQSLEDYEKDYLNRVNTNDGEDNSTPEPETDTDEGGDTGSKGGFITVEHTGADGRKYFEDNPITYGRSNIAETLKANGNDPLQVSRKQFTMFKESDSYYIEDGKTSVQDNPSGNHTTVNGKDITGQGKIKLNDGDVIELATVASVTFHILN